MKRNRIVLWTVAVIAVVGAGCGSTTDNSTTAGQKTITTKKRAKTKPVRFSGNGGKNLGAIRVATESVLRWTNDGYLFQVLPDNAVSLVNSTGKSGSTIVDAGTYKAVRVNAVGNWTLRIRPR